MIPTFMGIQPEFFGGYGTIRYDLTGITAFRRITTPEGRVYIHATLVRNLDDHLKRQWNPDTEPAPPIPEENWGLVITMENKEKEWK